MKVVVDTNVLVSGLLFGGVPGEMLTAWTSGAFVLVVSPSILSEYRRVGRELARGRPTLDVALIAVHATVVEAAQLDAPVSADPDDEQFLAAAQTGDAAWIVSGDKHLLADSGWSGITVLEPRAFVDGPLASRNR